MLSDEVKEESVKIKKNMDIPKYDKSQKAGFNPNATSEEEMYKPPPSSASRRILNVNKPHISSTGGVEFNAIAA